MKLFATGTITLGVLKLGSMVAPTAEAGILRPPGAVKEELFQGLCVRCGICLEVCPTQTIRLADFNDGIGAANTPKINPEAGPCEFFRGRCEDSMLCGKYCPTGALLTINKEKVKIGTVELNQGKCLSYIGKECVVCDEMCPVDEAITLTNELRPEFHGEKCVGCGICVYYCPAEPKALTLRTEGAKRV